MGQHNQGREAPSEHAPPGSGQQRQPAGGSSTCPGPRPISHGVEPNWGFAVRCDKGGAERQGP